MATLPCCTVVLAKAWLPLPAEDVTLPVRLSFCPTVVPATVTLNVHVPPAGSVAPDRLTLLELGAAEIVPPPHEPVKPFGLSTTNPLGNVSEKPMPVSAMSLGLVIVKFKLVFPVRGIAEATKDLLNVDGWIAEQVALPDP